jgi:DNA polymerase-3 subunit gamma/tau
MEKISGEVQTNLLSIKELTAIKTEDKMEGGSNHANRPKTPFSTDQLKMFWKKFAFKMKEEGNDTIYLAMVKRDPKIIGEMHVNHEVDNQVQIDYIQTHISELIEYLREQLKNWSITVDFTISDNLEENVKHQTGKDRFNALARKNPNLFTLQKTFNLDVEY